MPFASQSITNQMRKWTVEAGLPAGCTAHGLRTTLGKLIAESGGTTRELMDALGHRSIGHAELYSREADQQRLATAALGKVISMNRRHG